MVCFLHIKGKKDSCIRFLELFAGVGGIRLGDGEDES